MKKIKDIFKNKVTAALVCMTLVGTCIGVAGVTSAIAAGEGGVNAIERPISTNRNGSNMHTDLATVTGSVSGHTGPAVNIDFKDSIDGSSHTKTNGIYHMDLALSQHYYTFGNGDGDFAIGDDVFCLDLGLHVSDGDVYSAYAIGSDDGPYYNGAVGPDWLQDNQTTARTYTSGSYDHTYTKDGYKYYALNSEVYHVLEAYYSNKRASVGSIPFSFDEAQLLIWAAQLERTSDEARTDILAQYGTSSANINKILYLLSRTAVTANDKRNYLVWENNTEPGKQRLLSINEECIKETSLIPIFDTNDPGSYIGVTTDFPESFGWGSSLPDYTCLGQCVASGSSLIDSTGNFTAPDPTRSYSNSELIPLKWNTMPDGSGVDVAFGETVNIYSLTYGGKSLYHNKITPLYIIWQPIEVTVNFDKNTEYGNELTSYHSEAEYKFRLPNEADATGTTASQTISTTDDVVLSETSCGYTSFKYQFSQWGFLMKNNGSNTPKPLSEQVDHFTDYWDSYAPGKKYGGSHTELQDILEWQQIRSDTAYTASEALSLTKGVDYDYFDKKGSGEEYYAVKLPREVTLYAEWKGKPITVTYDGNGGVRDESNYLRAGIYGCDDASHSENPAITINSTIIGQESSNPAIYFGLYKKENVIGKIGSYNTAADGSGYAVAPLGSGYDYAEYDSLLSQYSEIPDSITLYAQWDTDTTRWGVTYDLNGGTGKRGDAITSLSSRITLWDGIDTAYGEEAITPPTDKVFVGWDTSADGSGTRYAPGYSLGRTEAGVAPGEKIKLYAIYADNIPCTLHYDLNGNDAVINISGTGAAYTDQTVGVGTTVKIGKGWNGSSYDSYNMTDVRDGDGKGYYFAGWTTTPTLPNEAGLSYTLYSGEQNASFGDSYRYQWSAPSGFNANYFYENKENVSHTVAGKDSVYIAGDTTMYAQVINEIAYVANYEKGSGGYKTIDYKMYSYLVNNTTGSVPALENPFTRDNYTFTGWNTEADGSGTAYAPGDPIRNEDAKTYFAASPYKTFRLYAMWERAPYKVTYDSNLSTYDSSTMYLMATGDAPVDSTAYPTSAPYGTATVLGYGTLAAKDLESSYPYTQYKVVGWTKEKNNKSASFAGTVYHEGDSLGEITEDTILYAKWDKANYSVTYKPNFPATATATTGTVPVDSISYDAAGTGEATVLGNTGNLACHEYTFKGWNTAADGTGLPADSVYGAGDTFTVTNNVTLYAQWEAKTAAHITYNGNGATSGTVPTDANVYYAGDNATVLGNTGTLTKTGSSFGGWTINADGSGTVYNAGDTYAITGNVTLYARWDDRQISTKVLTDISASYPNSEEDVGKVLDKDDFTVDLTYTITYDNGDTDTVTESNVSSDKYTIDPGSIEHKGDNVITVKAVEDPSVTDTVHITGVLVSTGDTGATMRVVANVTDRSPQYFTVKFNPNGGAGNMEDMTVYMDETSRLLTENAYAWANHEFAGWNTSPDGTGTPYADKANIAGATNVNHAVITLYAQWTVIPEPEYFTVKFNANGGTGSMSDMRVYMTETNRALIPNAFSKAGHSFSGWNTKPDGTGTPYANNANIAGATTVNHAVITLYAQWAVIPEPEYFTVKFNGNGGTGSMSDMRVYMTETNRLLISNAFSRGGYTFNGWNTVADGSGTGYAQNANIAGASNVNHAVITLYAQWKVIPVDNSYFTVKFHANGADGDTPDDMRVYLRETNRKLPGKGDLHYSGKRFDGWNTKRNGSGKDYDEGDNIAKKAKAGETIDLYAQWENKTTSSSSSSSSVKRPTSTSSSSSSTWIPPQPKQDPEPKVVKPRNPKPETEEEPKTPTETKTVSINKVVPVEPKKPEPKPTKPKTKDPVIEIGKKTVSGPNVEVPTEPEKKPTKIPGVVKGVVGALVTGAVGVALVMTGTLNYLWLLLLTLLFAKKRKKWHGILTAEENAFLKFEGANDDIPLAQDIIDKYNVPGQALAELVDTGSFTILPLGTKVDITYTDQNGELVTETFDDDEANAYDVLDQTTGKAVMHIYNGKAKMEFDLVFKRDILDDDSPL